MSVFLICVGYFAAETIDVYFYAPKWWFLTCFYHHTFVSIFIALSQRIKYSEAFLCYVMCVMLCYLAHSLGAFQWPITSSILRLLLI